MARFPFQVLLFPGASPGRSSRPCSGGSTPPSPRLFSACARRLRGAFFLAALLFAAFPARAQRASDDPPYAWNTSWNLTVEGAPTTTRIFLGVAEERRLLAVGGGYARLLRRSGGGWFGRLCNLYWTIEARPLNIEWDPAKIGVRAVDGHAVLGLFPQPFRVNFVDRSVIPFGPADTPVQFFYEWQPTYAASLSPIGVRLHFRPRRRLQPVVSASGGMFVSARNVPIDGARSFNFTFHFGTGVEYFLSQRRSLRLEFRIQHTSNAGTGMFNPGLDAPLIHISYAFRR